MVNISGAGRGDRTPMSLRSKVFETQASGLLRKAPIQISSFCSGPSPPQHHFNRSETQKRHRLVEWTPVWTAHNRDVRCYLWGTTPTSCARVSATATFSPAVSHGSPHDDPRKGDVTKARRMKA